MTPRARGSALSPAAWLGVIAVTLLSGCVTLEEGFYSCATEGRCPDGWSCWHDGLCRSATPAGLGVECDVDDECAFGLDCAESVDRQVEGGDYCSHTCEVDSECEDLDAESECFDGYCRIGCRDPEDCEGVMDTECRRLVAGPPPEGGPGMMPDPPPERPICLSIADPRITETSRCEQRMDCPAPGWCVYSEAISMIGVCTTICHGPGECPPPLRCVPVLIDAGLCLRPCTREGQECPDDLVCDTLGEETACVVSEWAGQPLPLPGTLSDTMGMDGRTGGGGG